MSLNFKEAIFSAIWNAVVANPSVTVKAGNRIDPRTLFGYLKFQQSGAPADRVEMSLRMTRTIQQKARATFGMNQNVPCGNPLIPTRQLAVLSFVYDNPKQGVQTAIESEALESIYGLYPKMNLSYVTGFEVAQDRRDESGEGKDKVWKRCDMTIVTDMRIRLNALT